MSTPLCKTQDANREMPCSAEIACKVEIVPLKGSSHTASTRATVFLTGLKNPLAVKSTAAGLLVGDWTTGRVYSITQR